jgi:hypothetical protein
MMRDRIENWDEFKAANGIVGWDDNVPACAWTGIVCAMEGPIIEV